MLCFLPFGFCQQKTPANSSKMHHGRHELERSDCCPEDGRDGPHERGEGFGDVRRKKIGECVPTEAEVRSETNQMLRPEPQVRRTSLPPSGRRPDA